MSVFERKRLRLIAKSPIHIGSVEQRITRFDFIHHGQYVYPISIDRLSVFLHKKNLIDSYVTAVEREGNRFKLDEFLRSKGVKIKTEDLEMLSNRRKIRVLADISRIQEFRPFIRDGFGVPYIPGTSIKGVIRTALLYGILKNLKETNKDEFEKIENKISDDIDREMTNEPRRRNKREFFKWANERWLEGFVLRNKTRSPNTDWLKMLHISDAYSVGSTETVLIPANILKRENNGWAYKMENNLNKTTIWVECIPENTIYEFDVLWDKKLLEEFKRENSEIYLPDTLSGIFEQVQSWARDVFEFEKNFSKTHDLNKWYQNTFSNFRIGFGSGMTSTTMIILFNENLRKKIRNYAGINRRDNIAPKSRRVWLKELRPIPFGWALIKEVNLKEV